MMHVCESVEIELGEHAKAARPSAFHLEKAAYTKPKITKLVPGTASHRRAGSLIDAALLEVRAASS